VDYLIREVNAYFVPDQQIQRGDVIDASIGVRPLVAQKADPTDLSREYELDLHTRGETKMLNVFGGKLTTYLSLSRQVAQTLGVEKGETVSLRA